MTSSHCSPFYGPFRCFYEKVTWFSVNLVLKYRAFTSNPLICLPTVLSGRYDGRRQPPSQRRAGGPNAY
jgi:hypothetical protein